MLEICQCIDHKANNLHKYFENYLNAIYKLPVGTVFQKKHCPDEDLASIFAGIRKGKPTDIHKLVDLFQESFLSLNTSERRKYMQIFKNTNNIAKLLATPKKAIRKEDYPGNTGNTTHALLLKLYEDTFYKTAFDIKDHYKEYYDSHSNGWCPFCGMEKYPLPGTRKADYDHLLSKSDYPAAAINLNNLVPMGDHCNRDFKKAKDLIKCEKGKPQMVAHPYSQTISPSISLKGSKANLMDEVKNSWKISITPRTHVIKAWNRLFEIEQRFRNDFLNKREDSKQETEFSSLIWSFVNSCADRRELQNSASRTDRDWTIDDLNMELSLKEKEFNNVNTKYKEANYLKAAVYEYLLNHADDTFKLSMLDSINAN